MRLQSQVKEAQKKNSYLEKDFFKNLELREGSGVGGEMIAIGGRHSSGSVELNTRSKFPF